MEWLTSQDNTIYSIGKTVKMLDDNKNVIKIFRYTGDALKYLKINSNTKCISNACNDNKKLYGYYWQYVKENEELEMPIYQFDDDIISVTDKDIVDIDHLDVY